MSTGPLNSSAPTTSILTGAVYNVTTPAPLDKQVCALQCDSTGKLLVTATFSGTISGNAAAGPTGAAVPASADFIGFNVAGNLVGVSAGNPLPVTFSSGTVTDTADMVGTTPGAAPANTQIVGAIYNSSAPTPTTGQTLPFQLDSSGRLIVNVGAGSSGNAAASATGSPVPANADYGGLNVAGTLRGQTGVNPAGSVYAAQTDLSSVGGASISLGQAAAASSIPVVSTSDGVTGVTAPTSATEIGWVNGSGNLVNVSAGTPLPVSGSISFTAPQHVIIDSGTVTTVSTVTAVTAITNALPAGTNVIGHVIVDSGTITTVSAVTAITNALPAGTNNLGKVQVLGNAGAAFDAAVNAAPPANAIQIGCLAATALPTANTATDLTVPMTDKFGRQVVIANTIRNLTGMQATTITSSTSATTIITAGASGVYNDIISLAITNSSATALIVTISDGTKSLVYAIAANGGIMIQPSSPIAATSAATAWQITCGTSVASIYVVAQFAANK